MKLFKRILCVLSCAALLTCATAPAFAASTSEDNAVSTLNDYGAPYEYETRGPLLINGHLFARMGYETANYHIYISDPDAVGIRINDMPIATTNEVVVYGTAQEIGLTGDFGDITVKITVFYEDRAPYTAYETFDLNSYYCGRDHALTDRCHG